MSTCWIEIELKVPPLPKHAGCWGLRQPAVFAGWLVRPFSYSLLEEMCLETAIKRLSEYFKNRWGDVENLWLLGFWVIVSGRGGVKSNPIADKIWEHLENTLKPYQANFILPPETFWALALQFAKTFWQAQQQKQPPPLEVLTLAIFRPRKTPPPGWQSALQMEIHFRQDAIFGGVSKEVWPKDVCANPILAVVPFGLRRWDTAESAGSLPVFFQVFGLPRFDLSFEVIDGRRVPIQSERAPFLAQIQKLSPPLLQIPNSLMRRNVDGNLVTWGRIATPRQGPPALHFIVAVPPSKLTELLPTTSNKQIVSALSALGSIAFYPPVHTFLRNSTLGI